jgi:anionic cell wall polymer biosynthesis LytR-Cps2A-Psr (LCP) family protein
MSDVTGGGALPPGDGAGPTPGPPAQPWQPAAAAPTFASDTIVPGGPPAIGAEQSGAEVSRAARRRAAEESAREAQQTSRRRLLVVSGSVLGLLALIGLVWTFSSRTTGDASPAPTGSASATGPTQPTLLFQIRDKENLGIDNALLSVGGPFGRANMITIPSTTIVDVATGGTLPFGQVARLPDPNSSADALSDAIGVNVNATLAMDTLAFSGLVDAVGGVTVDVDVDVVAKQADGTSLVLVPAGKAQLLQGPQAAAYATFLGAGEAEEARMARFTTVLHSVVEKLPQDATKIEAIFTSLGASSRATVPTPQVAAFFERLHYDVIGDDIVLRPLPVKPIDSGGPSAYRIDADASAAMVQELLPAATRTPGPNSKVRVLVQNGVGSPGLNAAARQLLVDAGFTYVNGGNAASFGQVATEIVVPDATPDSLKWGADIAAALKVPGKDVVVATSGQSVADVIVVLGADFVPPKA